MLTCAFSGLGSALAPPGVISLVHRIVGLSGVRMATPFRVQCSVAPDQWVDFPFIDQLEIASRICSLVTLRTMPDLLQFPVLDADAMFEIHLTEGVATLSMFRVEGSVRGGVRMVEVGDFFAGRLLKFADGVVVS